MYLNSDESLDTFENLYHELLEAYELRKNMLNDLFKEIKNVKKLSI